MSAHRKDLSASDRVRLSAKIVALPEVNRSALAREADISRPTLYAIENKGRRALSAAFSPEGPAQTVDEGYWVRIDASAIERACVMLRASCGATLSTISEVLSEMYRIRISRESLRQVLQQGYQRAFDYHQGVDLSPVDRACFDEFYRWRRCVFTGVDADSLFIFLAEKESNADADTWSVALERLRDEHGLDPGQIASDASSSIENAATNTWPQARFVFDINHAFRALREVVLQADQAAYKAIEACDQAANRFLDGPTARTDGAELEDRYIAAAVAEQQAIERAEQAAQLVERAYHALSIVHPKRGKVQTLASNKETLLEVATELRDLGTAVACKAASYLRNTCQRILEQRQRFVEIMHQIAEQLGVDFEQLEVAVCFWQCDRRHRNTAPRASGLRQRLCRQMYELLEHLQKELGRGAARKLLETLYMAFEQVLAASSAVEWANERIAAPLPPQKRLSSGYLHLRTAWLNLHEFRGGRRKGHSPHELLSGEHIDDWLAMLGYAPRDGKIRTFKKLGWRRLVQPCTPTCRRASDSRIGHDTAESIVEETLGQAA